MTSASICTIGDEILIGQVIDTNSSDIARALNSIGIVVRRMVSISDEKHDIISSLEKELSENEIVIVTGGLGPTKDDITKPALAELSRSISYKTDQRQLKIIRDILSSRGLDVLDINLAQASVPDTCEVIPNKLGTAPVMVFRFPESRFGHKATLFSLPGVPYEVRGNGEMFPLNGPAWSLFFEYIGNILYALIIRRLSTKMLALFTVIMGCLHAWFFVGNVSGYDMVGVGWTIDEINFWGGLVRMLFPFTMGMLLARTFKPRKIKGAFWICSIMLIALFSVPYIPSAGNISINSLYEVVCIATIFPFIVWVGACGISSGKTAKINRQLGDISYPLYIVHYPIMYIFYAWLIEKKYYTLQDCWEVALIVVVSSILLAFICLKLYDEPVRRWLTRKFK